jgi:hypothetical protein
MLGSLSRLIGKVSAGSRCPFEETSDERLSEETKARIKRNLSAG